MARSTQDLVQALNHRMDKMTAQEIVQDPLKFRLNIDASFGQTKDEFFLIGLGNRESNHATKRKHALCQTFAWDKRVAENGVQDFDKYTYILFPERWKVDVVDTNRYTKHFSRWNPFWLFIHRLQCGRGEKYVETLRVII